MINPLPNFGLLLDSMGEQFDINFIAEVIDRMSDIDRHQLKILQRDLLPIETVIIFERRKEHEAIADNDLNKLVKHFEALGTATNIFAECLMRLMEQRKNERN
jgi:hypothetical protein